MVLLAGMNRGWAISHHTALARVVIRRSGTLLGSVMALVAGRPPVILTIHRGAPFLTELPLQWIGMRQHVASKDVGAR